MVQMTLLLLAPDTESNVLQIVAELNVQNFKQIKV